MNSSRPYLLRAIYEWIVDNGMTPYLLVNAEHPHVVVPVEHVNNGKIILNIAPEAVQGLDMANEELSFNARFSGKPMHVSVPIAAALAIYARENGRGMVFNDEEDQGPDEPPREKSTGPKLRVVK
ncbi:MAG TPA: ClpXP protease specificity-enhancing factor [Gammaproteobacteria bacterium]|nr:ClpXP protease specificity-enhancing factor [Gammaproteobacteria bacterium]